jgi:hypothetical protein
MKKLIAEAWRDFEIQIIPLDAHEIQRTECRRAFYAGALSLFSAVTGRLSPGEEPTEKDLAMLDDLHVEINEYAADLRAGRA